MSKTILIGNINVSGWLSVRRLAFSTLLSKREGLARMSGDLQVGWGALVFSSSGDFLQVFS